MDNNNEIGIVQLRQKIEEKVGREMLTPKDFDYLSDCIFEECHQKISPTTLKRLWGYLSEVASPRISTLNILSQFTGYEDWESFCLQAHSSIEQEAKPAKKNDNHILKWLPYAVIILLLIGGLWMSYGRTPYPNNYVLVQGQKFATYHDYLRLFGIENSPTYWGCPLPHHPSIVLWGPEFQHPHWHNDGDPAKMYPTITERWEPEGVDSAMVIMRNRDKYNHDTRLNEVRITFMKNLVDTGYVFLGVYRLSLSQSDTTHCVWERVAN